jgi:hypothetical protein
MLAQALPSSVDASQGMQALIASSLVFVGMIVVGIWWLRR